VIPIGVGEVNGVHEYSIARALMRRVQQEAEARGACGVRRVGVRVGELAGVDPGLLRTAYEHVRACTVCADAPLEIAWVAVEWRCVPCGISVSPAGPLRCPGCGGPATLGSGDELVLERIEMEVA
jgi:hydrogenase nickel incorporation protein HypA/HybF